MLLEKIEGKDLSERLGKHRFQELVLCSNEGRAATREDGDDGLAALQERLEEAPAAIKATTTALRIKSKYTVPNEIREMAAVAAKCRDPTKSSR